MPDRETITPQLRHYYHAKKDVHDYCNADRCTKRRRQEFAEKYKDDPGRGPDGSSSEIQELKAQVDAHQAVIMAKWNARTQEEKDEFYSGGDKDDD